jgi:uncharacterized protein (UPF0335 family)
MSDTLGGNAQQALRSIVERVERLTEEKAALAGDIREIFAEAKSTGFDTKAIKEIIKIRKQDRDKRREEMSVLETYMHALGMLD